MDAYYLQRDQRERIHQRAHNLRRFLQNALERDEKKLAIQRQTLLDAENMDDLRRKGDLITSSLHCIRAARARPSFRTTIPRTCARWRSR